MRRNIKFKKTTLKTTTANKPINISNEYKFERKIG